MNSRNSSTPPGQRTRWWGKAALLGAAFAFFGLSANAQVSAYTFSQSAGTFTPLSASRTIVFTATALATADPGLGDDRNFTLAAGTIPFTYTFNGTGYTGVNINTNGYVTFGATLPLSTDRSGISNSTAWSGSIVARGSDLSANTNATNLGEISYEVLGTSPNRTFAIQYSKFRRFSSSSTFTENYNFQILLNENGNTAQIVYGACISTAASSCQVGLRGAANTDFNNRTSTTNWAATTAGGTNSATVTHSTTVNPASGQTFTWTPPTPCTGTPSAAVIPSTTGACNGATATITASSFQTGLAGISFQWQESPDGVNSWANVVGGTGATTTSYITTAVTATRFFRLNTICSAAPLSPSNSNVCTVNLSNCEFTVARSTGITYSSIAGTGTNYSGWTSTTNTDDATTGTVSLAGTSFTYQGATITGFRACTNGWMTFNTASTSTAFSNNLGSTTNNFTLAPFWDDLVCTGNTSTNAGQNASMKFQIVGTLGSGSAKIIAEWIGMETFNNAGPNLNFQVVLDEVGNTITYNYGTMEAFSGTADYAYSYSLGMNGITVPTTPASYRDVMALRDENTTNFTFTGVNTTNSGTNNQIYLPVCNSRYVFTPAGAYPGPGVAPTITPANDNPGTAIGLPVNSSPCTSLCNTYFRNQGGTASAGITACGAATPGTPDDDVWFTFVATTPLQTITVRGAGGMDPVIQLFSDAGITSLACVNAGTTQGGTETLNATGLTPSATYYVRVYHAGAGANGTPTPTNNNGSPVTGAGAFSICVNEVQPPPANDDICGAIDLTVGPTCVTTAGSTLNATISTTTPAPTCGTGFTDIWYRFTALTTGDVLTVQSGTGFNAAVAIYTGTNSCPTVPTLTAFSCVNSTSTAGVETTSGPWIVGTIYWVRVYNATGGIGGTGSFTICMTATVPACATGNTPANAAIVCGNAAPQNISWSATSGASGYDVYFDAGAGPATTLVSSNQAGTSYAAGTLAFGQYTYRIVPRNGLGPAVGCTDNTFTVNAVPVATITPSGATTFCAPGSVDLTASAGGSYLWSPGGATTQTINVTASGSYTVQVTTAGCSATSSATVVTVNQPPTMGAVSATPSTVCEGGNSQLQALATVPGYTAGNSGPAFIDISGTGTTVGTLSDDSEHNITIPSFVFNGVTYTAGRVGTNGVLVLGSSTGDVSTANATLPSSANSAGNVFLAPWWDDLDVQTLPTIRTETVGNTFIVQWTNMDHDAIAGGVNGITFQIQMDLTTGVVYFVYSDVSFGNVSFDAGASATAGVQWANAAGNFVQSSFNTASLSDGQVISYSPNQPTFSWSPNTFLNNAAIANPLAQAVTATTGYTVTALAPNGCPSTGGVTVTMQAAPDAGANGTYTGCSTDAAFNLFAQLTGTPDAGGTWTDPSNAAHGATFTPGTDAPGAYTYTVNATAPCVGSVTATVTVNITTASVWYADVDGDGLGSGPTTGTSCTAPNPGDVTNNTDPCPFGPNPGSACNDGNPFTSGDVIQNDCSCAGTPAPSTTWTLEFTTDNVGSESTWQIVDATSPFVLDAGGPYASNTTTTENVVVPTGACFNLIVTDANGMSNGTTGGWILRDSNGKRVIDNSGDAVFAGTSQADLPFCSPVGNDAIIASQCDKVDWTPGQIIIASPNAAVTAQFGVNNANSGYEFWFFNPDGGYSRRVFLTHANPGQGGPTGATKCAHLSYSNLQTNPVPANVLLNVRVRSVVNGVYSDFGAACRFKIDQTAANCPLTQLISTPGATFSCGATGKIVKASGNTGRIYAQPTTRVVNGSNQPANAYWFEITGPGGYVRNITSSTYVLVLGQWVTNPLLCGTNTYDVRVRASFNGGATWCPFGAFCTVGITNNLAAPYCTSALAFAGGDDRMFFDGDETSTEAVLTLWPNPNNGEQLYVTINALNADVATATVDIFDLVGHKVGTHTIPVNGSTLNTVIDLDASMANGMYLVNVTVGDQTFIQRLVIQ